MKWRGLFSLTILVALMVSFSAGAQNRTENRKIAYYFGGGGESHRSENMFDETYESFSSSMKRAGWELNSYFDGGHATSRALQKQVDPQGQSATTANIEAALKKLESDIRDGKLHQSDKIFLHIDTHGRKRDANESVHSIKTEDGSINIEKFSAVIRAAEQKGIKIALVDDTCLSGDTIKLGTDKTCVMAGSTPNNYGYPNASKEFLNAIKPGHSLEEAFLRARNNKIASYDYFNNGQTSHPVLSSPAARELDKFFEKLEDKFLSLRWLYSGSRYRPQEIEEHLRKLSACMPQFHGLLKQFQDLKGIFSQVKDRALVGDLEKKIEDLRVALEDLRVRSDEPEYCLKRSKREKYDPKALCYKYSTLPSVILDREGTIKDFQRQKNEKEAEVFQKDLEELKKVAESTDYKSFEKKREEKIKKAEKLALDFIKSERKLYESLYRQLSSEMKEPNPCRDFIF